MVFSSMLGNANCAQGKGGVMEQAPCQAVMWSCCWIPEAADAIVA